MSTDTTTEPDSRPRPKVLPWIIAIVAAAVVAAIGFALLDTSDDDTAPPAAGGGDQTVTELTMAAPQGRCMAPDATTLAQAQLAFEGSVVSVSDGVVTLEPATWYAGDHTDRVTVTQADAGLKDLVGAVDFRPGEEYFVAANAGKMMVCGFSGEKSSDLSTLYQEAFSGSAT